jgi:RNA polymerase sigma-70 factor (ECF subfamily)
MSSVGEIQAGRLAVSKGIPETVAFPEDLALARRAALREEAAWREIYDVTRDRLFALLSYYTGQREEALELLQETYLGAIRSIDRYRGDGSLMSWMAIIAIRRARDWRRKLVQLKRTREALVAEQSNDPAPLPDEHVRLQVRAAISELKGHQRGAFLMRELEGMSFREIGNALGCDEATARVHYFRARQTMKNLLAPDETRDEGSLRTISRLRAVKQVNPNREADDEEARS